MDHRLGMRRRTQTVVEVCGRNGVRTEGLVYNISQDGMFVVCEPPPDVNDSVDVYMPKGPKSVRIPGFVVHRNVNGVGMIFRHLDDSARALVHRCLR